LFIGTKQIFKPSVKRGVVEWRKIDNIETVLFSTGATQANHPLRQAQGVINPLQS
jgi:hypothetical protein